MSEFLGFLHDFFIAFGQWANLDFWEVMFAASALLFILIIYRLHRSSADNYRFTGNFTDEVTGKASARHLFAFGAFLVHSWATARYCAFTTLDDKVIVLLAVYATIWAGVLMLGNALNTMAEGVAAWLGARKAPAP